MNTTLTALCCLLLLALYSWYTYTKAAFESFSRSKFKNLAENDKKTTQILSWDEAPEQLLSATRIGKTISILILAALSEHLFLQWLPRFGLPISIVADVVAILLFGELLPRAIGQAKADKVIRSAFWPLRIRLWLATPLTIPAEKIKQVIRRSFQAVKTEDESAEDELITLVDEAEEEGELTKQAGDLIRSAIEFNDREVQDILTPRVNVVAVDESDSNEEISRLFAETGLSRLPVYSETIDNIIGILHEKDFFKFAGQKSISQIMSPTLCVSPHMKISDLMRKLQKEQSHLAIVVDEFGGTEGIVTLEDILEELVGDIWDEHDEVVEYFKQVDKNTYLIFCEADLQELFELFEVEPQEESDAVTISGWVIQEIGKLPEVGDMFQYQGLTVTITQTDSRKVLEIKVQKEQRPEEEEPTSK